MGLIQSKSFFLLVTLDIERQYAKHSLSLSDDDHDDVDLWSH